MLSPARASFSISAATALASVSTCGCDWNHEQWQQAAQKKHASATVAQRRKWSAAISERGPERGHAGGAALSR